MTEKAVTTSLSEEEVTDTFVYSGGNDVIVNFNEEEDRLDMGNLQYGIDYIMQEFTNPLGQTGVEFIFA